MAVLILLFLPSVLFSQGDFGDVDDLGNVLFTSLMNSNVKTVKSRFVYSLESERKKDTVFRMVYLFPEEKRTQKNFPLNDSSVQETVFLFYNKAGELTCDSTAWNGDGGPPYVVLYSYNKLGLIETTTFPQEPSSPQKGGSINLREYHSDSVLCYRLKENGEKTLIFIEIADTAGRPFQLFSYFMGAKKLNSEYTHDKSGLLIKMVNFTEKPPAIYSTSLFTYNKLGLPVKCENTSKDYKGILTITYEYEFNK